ncbi:hypothetical protein A2V71_04425 [Candidatus Berkelbacteria bacterium RBG_13_40_8]|uniref:Uncharacterized protein n=1 Tax=Candidatus Berkelbacteria bacterium RBG_13_40_8 TaxID=1797467 RepID=A0A1F5DMA3_9BACT|nr:MAG: hypothetical protein A2V71_04425 [Candidatus Berkelbacteria bacterium RBG_13_40_8]
MNEINSGLVANSGIIFDIIGAFFLAESFLLKKNDKIIKESSSYFDGNPFLLPSYIIQRLEARTGFFFLMLGFLLQYFANSEYVSQGRDKYTLALLVIGFISWIIAFIILKIIGKALAQKALIKEDGKNFLRGIEDTKKQNNENFTKLVKFYGDALDIPQKRGENTIVYSKRIVNLIKKGLPR